MHKILAALAIFIFLFSPSIFSAIKINNLNFKPTSLLFDPAFLAAGNQIKEKNRVTDFNNTLHVRAEQTYKGYSVWNSEFIVHIPHQGHSNAQLSKLITNETFINGAIYQNLKQDLDSAPSFIFSNKQLESAIDHVVSLQKNKIIKNQEGNLIIYTDDKDKGRWAFEIKIFIEGTDQHLPQQLIYIMDAVNFIIYEHWDNIQTDQKLELKNTKAGGFAGNHKTGKKMLDGLAEHFPSLEIQRDEATKTCYMQNTRIGLINAKTSREMTFQCDRQSAEHNNIYWNGSHDMVETTWSPSNDVMFGLEMTIGMFNDWYRIPVIQQNGKPLFIPVVVHSPVDNAYWDGTKAVFGNSIGSEEFNPFTQLDTVGHEICHGFTEQHSNLHYNRQSGGINEAFSDMAGIAAEYYAYGKTDFLVGLGDVKAENIALRYMDKPSKDCDGKKPGDWCSIDHISQYYNGLNVHFSSGIFNRVYYYLANARDWNAKKAFDVMVQANMSYWRSTSGFSEAACGVKLAAKDYRYNLKAVDEAFDVVGINTKQCES